MTKATKKVTQAAPKQPTTEDSRNPLGFGTMLGKPSFKFQMKMSLLLLNRMRQVIHGSGLVLAHADECCDEGVYIDLSMSHGRALMQCAERMQEKLDEIDKWVFDDSQDKEQSATSEREKAS